LDEEDMKKFPAFLCIAALCLPLAAGAQSMQPGEWEISSSVSSPMLPKPQSATVTRCVSKEDAADPARLTAGPSTQGCTVTPGARAAGSFKWAIACPAQGVTGTGVVHYTDKSMDSEIHMAVDMEGKKTDMFTKVSGRYLGPCKAK
jgi:Protein of unknown function (DUF3617)